MATFPRRFGVALLLIVLLIVAACSSPAPQAQPPTQAATEEPAAEQPAPAEPTEAPQEEEQVAPTEAPQEEEQVAPTEEPQEEAAGEPITLRVGLVGDIQHLDPHEAVGLSETVWTYVYEGMGELDEQGVAQPALATSWEYVSPTRLEFDLRPGVTFHDGTPWNAEEAVKSINRMIDPESPGPDVNYYSAVTSAEVVDEDTVAIELSHPDPIVLQAMSMSFFVMTPADHGESLASNPVGTGPWKFVEWVPNQYVRYERNDDWWGEPKPSVDFLEFRFFQEETTRMLALQAGEIDIAFNISPSILQMAEGDPNLTVISEPTPRILIIDLNVKAPPTDDPRVRHAISLAIDTQGIVEGIAGDAAEPITAFYASFYPDYYDAGFIEYDPEAAAALLEEAGWVDSNGDGIREKDGQNLTLTWMVADARDPWNRDMPTAAQEMLAAVGFDVELVFTDLATLRDAALEPDPGAYNLLGMRGFSNATFDPIHTLLQYQVENVSPTTAGGESRYTTPEVDQMIKDYLASTDPEEKSQLLRDIQDQLYEDMPSIPLYSATRFSVLGPDVTFFDDHPNEWYTYRFNTTEVQR